MTSADSGRLPFGKANMNFHSRQIALYGYILNTDPSV